jgi:hypothetical protein
MSHQALVQLLQVLRSSALRATTIQAAAGIVISALIRCPWLDCGRMVQTI